ncbi:hypothetical protein MPER_07324, partial [Moniliophthora perniciosa FA553]
MSKHRVLYWFRTDLRLHSSPALHAALSLQPEALYPIWTWDPEYVYAHRVGVNRSSLPVLKYTSQGNPSIILSDQ